MKAIAYMRFSYKSLKNNSNANFSLRFRRKKFMFAHPTSFLQCSTITVLAKTTLDSSWMLLTHGSSH